MLKGRLGLETARVPQADRHGLLWLARGKLTVEDGNLVFVTAGSSHLEAGRYQIPFQTISNLLLGPGTTISHDALRLLNRQQTGLLAVGTGGVRLYAVSMPFGPDRARLARRQARLWADDDRRIDIARKMYGIRLGEILPQRDLNALRGVEGQRVKRVYAQLARQHGVEWKGRQYDRDDPESSDIANQAINHASTAMYAAARIAVSVTGTLPQLGFIHESSGQAFCLDIADLLRSSHTLPIAFRATKRCMRRDGSHVERVTRRLAARTLQERQVVPAMIEIIKRLLDVDDDRGDA